MHPEWKNFLLQRGAVVQQDAVQHYGDADSEIQVTARADVIADLSHLCLLRVHGEDAARFLQGQFSNDIPQVDATRSQLSACCTAQGRVLAIFRVFIRDGYLLQLPMALCDNMLERLRMYVLRSKVILETADPALLRIGVAGPTCEGVLQKHIGALPQDTDACVTHDGVTLLRLPGPLPRFEIIAGLAEATSLWRDLAQHATPVGAPAWAWLDIMAGIPTIHPQTAEMFLPQMVNLDLLGAVNFEKGCYSGQEIIARVHYLGRVKQRMYRAHASTDGPRAGEAIYTTDQPEHTAGTIVDAQRSAHGGCDLLAVIEIEAAQRDSLHLGGSQQARLALAPLPYAVAGVR